MIAADASLSTVGPSYNVRLASGPAHVRRLLCSARRYRPSAPTDNYRQFRAGLHVTAFAPASFEWSAGAGWATDTDDRSGAYGKLGVFTRL